MNRARIKHHGGSNSWVNAHRLPKVALLPHVGPRGIGLRRRAANPSRRRRITDATDRIRMHRNFSGSEQAASNLSEVVNHGMRPTNPPATWNFYSNESSANMVETCWTEPAERHEGRVASSAESDRGHQRWAIGAMTLRAVPGNNGRTLDPAGVMQALLALVEYRVL